MYCVRLPEEIVMPLLDTSASMLRCKRADRRRGLHGRVEFPLPANKVAAIVEKRYDLDLDGSFAYPTRSPTPDARDGRPPVAVNPDRALLKEATSRGWEIRVFERPQPLVQGRGARPSKPMTLGALGAATLAGGLLWWKTRKPMGRRR